MSRSLVKKWLEILGLQGSEPENETTDLCALVLCALRVLVPHVLCALRTLVSHVLSCLTWFLCLVTCVVHANITFSVLIFQCFTRLFLVYLQVVAFFVKFTTVKIKIICSQHFEATVSINKQYDVFELYLRKYIYFFSIITLYTKNVNKLKIQSTVPQ